MTLEDDARRQVDGRIHGLKIRLGRARAEMKHAETLAQKIARCGRVKEFEGELRSLYQTYWDEVEKLEEQADSSAPNKGRALRGRICMLEGVTVTQTAQKPVQLTLATMLAKFKDSHPHLVAPFEQIKPDLEQGTGQQALANLIHCEVETRTEQGLTIYKWEGKSDTFELSVPKPLGPHPQRSSETQQQAQVQVEPQAPPEAPQDTPEPAQAPEPQPEDTPELEPGTPELPEAAGTTAEAALGAAPGMFASLAALLGDSTLLMTVARTGKEGDEPVLTVTVVPQGEEAFTPMCLTGSVSELDTQFVSALAAKADSKKSLAEQIEAAKAADKALEDAKKQEVAAKTKQAAAKTKAAQKKEEDAKAEENAEAGKQQEKLF